MGALLALSLLVGVPGGFLLARSMIESRVTDTIGAFHEAHRDGNHDRAMDLSCGELAASIDDGVVAAEDSEGTVDVDRVEWRRVGAATVYYHLSSDTPGSGNSAERVAKVDNVDGQWRLCEDFEVG